MISGHRDLSSEAMLFIFFTIISTTSPAFGSVRKIFCILFLIRSAIYYRNYVALTWPSSDTTCAHYLFLRFLPAVPSLCPSGKRPKTNQGRTKDEPRNYQRTSKYKKCCLLRLPFPFLIPCLISPREDREMTERRATELLHDFLCKSLDNSKKSCIFVVESPTPGFRGREMSHLGKPNAYPKTPVAAFKTY